MDMKQERTRKNKKSRRPDEQPLPSPAYRSLPCTRVKGNLLEPCIIDAAEEMPVALFINGRHATTVMISPVDPEDFVTGYLVTEELIKTTKEIESMKIEKNRISVITRSLFKVLPQKKTILSGCGGSTSYIDVEKLAKIHSDFSVNAATVAAALRSHDDTETRRTALGLTTSILHDSQQVIGTAEDIGGLNAVDRSIGHAVRNGVYLSQTFLITSGQVSSETVRKCLTANIPIVVSRGAATTLAIEMAERTGMTVIGGARDGNLDIYSHPERITMSVP